MDFISLLIRHIPDWNFKMIHYYGLYARHRKQDKSLRRAIQKNWHPILKSFNRWRAGISSSFGYDPLKCAECGHQMILVDPYRSHIHIPLKALYERTMLKARQKAGCRSS